MIRFRLFFVTNDLIFRKKTPSIQFHDKINNMAVLMDTSLVDKGR
jgi:hypothetical protein